MPKSGGSGKKWVIFGCGGCLVLILAMAALGAGITFFVFGTIKKTDVVATALKRAQDSPQVQSALGTPIDLGWWISGSVKINNGSGNADITGPIAGPKGEGTLQVKASKPPGGTWEYSQVDVLVTNGEKINLLEGN